MLNNFSWLNKKTVIIIIVIVAVAGGLSMFRSYAGTPDTSKAHVDFSEFHPNTSINTTHFLSTNHTSGQEGWAVLWFSGLDKDGRYRMYNSNPASEDGACHWDDFQWTDTGLMYNSTVRDSQSVCGGTEQSHKVTYSPGITYLPRLWNGKSWLKEGRSVATYSEGGVSKCHGTIQWKTEIFEAPVELSKGVTATHMRSTQTTSWTHGSGSSTGCAPGVTSRYQENLYFVTDLQVKDSQTVTRGLKRSVGGNLDRYDESEPKKWDWDVWFHEWRSLPDNMREVYVNEPLSAARPDSFTRMSEGLTGAKNQTITQYNDTVLYAGKRPYTVMKLGKNTRTAGDSLKFTDSAALKSYIDKEIALGAKKFKLCIAARVPYGTAITRIVLFGKATSISVKASENYAHYCGEAVASPAMYSSGLAPFVDVSGADLLVDAVSLEQSK